MGFLRKLDRSAELVSGMADRLGIDMTEALLADADRAGPQLRTMVMTCTGCREQGACTRLQAEHDHLDAPPSYCLNGARFKQG